MLASVEATWVRLSNVYHEDKVDLHKNLGIFYKFDPCLSRSEFFRQHFSNDSKVCSYQSRTLVEAHVFKRPEELRLRGS